MTKRVRFVLVPFLLMLLIQAIFIQIQFIYAQSTIKPVRVNGNITDSFLLLDHQPQVAAFGNNVYIAWVSHYTGNDDIYFTKSSDGGASFGKIINLSNDPGDSYNPHLAIDGKNVYVVWVDGTPGPYGNPDILFRRSTNGGTTFDATVNISDNPGFSTEPELALSGNNVYVVWRDNTPGNEEIFFKRSINNGASFGSLVYVSDNSTKPINSVRPQISANANNVYLVWSKGNFDEGHSNVLFKRSINNGASFGRTLNISNTPTALSTLQKVYVVGNRVYVVWTEGNFYNRQIFFKRSVDGGATFSPTMSLSNPKGQSQYPDITTFNNNIYAIWQDRILGNVGIFFKRIM
jgi:hypothetical protein